MHVEFYSMPNAYEDNFYVSSKNIQVFSSVKVSLCIKLFKKIMYEVNTCFFYLQMHQFNRVLFQYLYFLFKFMKHAITF